MSSSQLAAHTRNVEERGEESSDQSRHFKPEPHDRSDVEVFSSDEGVLCLHSFLLMMHSKVFAAAFSNDDMPVKHLSIEHDYKTLKTFFSAFGYTMNYQRLISKDNAIALAELAFKYDVPHILDTCIERIYPLIPSLPIARLNTAAAADHKASTEATPASASTPAARAVKKPKLKRSDTVIKTDIESERGKGDIRIESLVTLLLLAQRINNDCLYAHIIKEMSSRYEGYIAFEKQPEACKTQGGRNKYADYEAMVAQFFNETDSKAAFDLLRASHGVAITSGRGADDVDVDDGGCRCSPWLLKAILDERGTTMMNVPCEVFRDNAWHNGVVNKLDHSMGYTRAYVHYTVEMHVDKPRMAYDFVSILPDQIRLH